VATQYQLTEANLGDYLRRIGLVSSEGELTVEPAGDGNINWVRRARLSEGRDEGVSPRSWIVKQARPALERFPEYRVSTERLIFEHRWYEAVARWDEDAVCPRILGFVAEDRVLVLEDLGEAERLDARLARGGDAGEPVSRLAAFLGRIHAATRDPSLAAHFANDAMKTLHGDHIFLLPLRPNEFPLAPEVAKRAAVLQGDPELVACADAAYARYREPRGALVHADVQAGNVLLTDSGPKLLDAEIAHVGDPAFDLGVLLAHLVLPALAGGSPGDVAPRVGPAWESYCAAHGPGHPDFAEVARYAGLEVVRRTIGAARLPSLEDPDAALGALDRAVGWITRPPGAPRGLR
jgi:5-methylthioribose kinase